MRSNRSNYHSAPAGSSRALDRKPKPMRSRRELNQLMLMVFFMALPVLGLLAIFFQPIRWMFMVVIVAALIMMWLTRAFLFPGRMVLTAAYGLLFVFTMVTALNTSAERSSLKNADPFANYAKTSTVSTTPKFNYSVMGTNVPDGYYNAGEGDMLSGLQSVNMAGGSADESGADLGLSSAGENAYIPIEKSEAEIVLEEFMLKWSKGVISDMTEHTAPSWQKQQDSAERQLFWKFKQKPLLDWRQLSAPSGTDTSTARTIVIEADVTYNNETRTYQYDALILYENGAWYVDPNSLSTGILVQAATPTPDPNATPTPSPKPTPTPTINPKLKLYYNSDGGRMYHADKECYTVDKEYLPLASFTYNQLTKSPYNKLKPCDKCNPPE